MIETPFGTVEGYPLNEDGEVVISTVVQVGDIKKDLLYERAREWFVSY